MEKRNVIETQRTPGVKTADDASRDEVKEAAAGFNSKRVCTNGLHGKKSRSSKDRV